MSTSSNALWGNPRRPWLYRVGIGSMLAACVAALTIAVWPASAAETARDDGERLGAAVAALYEADTAEEVDEALIEVRDAAEESRDHSSEELDEQIDSQVDALDRAVDGFVGMHETDSDWDYELYEAELDTAVEDLEDQAEEFRTEAPEVVDAFWEGFDEGLGEGLSDDDTTETA